MQGLLAANHEQQAAGEARGAIRERLPFREQRIPKNKLFDGAIRALDVPEQGVYNEPCGQAKPGEGFGTFARLMEPHWNKEVVLSQLCPSTSTNAEPAALASSGARR
jgi:hypothetical protein